MSKLPVISVLSITGRSRMMLSNPENPSERFHSRPPILVVIRHAYSILARQWRRPSTGRWQWDAASFLKRLQLGDTFAKSKLIDGSVPAFVMDLQLQPVFEKRLRHRPFYHLPAWMTLRLCVDSEHFGMNPLRTAFDSKNFHRIGMGSREPDVCPG
jgi:hypothetical protein